jgi:hypothetical protein
VGLGVYLVAELPRRGWLQRPPRRDSLWKSIAATVAEFVKRQPPPLQGWMSTSVQSDVLSLNLFPSEEDVEFSLTGDRIVCSAKTSTAGPGYHAYLIDLLDELQRAEGLSWDESIEDSQDETGFRAARDFGRLQASMAEWLRFLVRHVIENMSDFNPPILLGMPIGFMPRTTAFAASPMGEWSREWLTEVAAAEGDRLLALASQYFCWWERGVSARNLRSFGLVQCWMDIRWTAPQDATERRLLESALASFDAAARLDPTLEVPAAADELRALLARRSALAEPAPTGVGFRRRPMARDLSGNWTVDLPGYFDSALEDDGATQVYSFPGKTVRGSWLSLKAREGATAADLVRVGSKPDDHPLPVTAGHLAGRYSCAWDPEQRCHVLHATAAKIDGVCVVTIAFDDARDRPWAESVAATIFAPKPRAENETTEPR